MWLTQVRNVASLSAQALNALRGGSSWTGEAREEAKAGSRLRWRPSGTGLWVSYTVDRHAVEVDAETVPTVRSIISMVADGMALYAVGKVLTQEGVTTLVG